MLPAVSPRARSAAGTRWRRWCCGAWFSVPRTPLRPGDWETGELGPLGFWLKKLLWKLASRSAGRSVSDWTSGCGPLPPPPTPLLEQRQGTCWEDARGGGCSGPGGPGAGRCPGSRPHGVCAPFRETEGPGRLGLRRWKEPGAAGRGEDRCRRRSRDAYSGLRESTNENGLVFLEKHILKRKVQEPGDYVQRHTARVRGAAVACSACPWRSRGLRWAASAPCAGTTRTGCPRPSRRTGPAGTGSPEGRRTRKERRPGSRPSKERPAGAQALHRSLGGVG